MLATAFPSRVNNNSLFDPRNPSEWASQTRTYPYSPAKPSPLSPRSPNIHGRSFHIPHVFKSYNEMSEIEETVFLDQVDTSPCGPVLTSVDQNQSSNALATNATRSEKKPFAKRDIKPTPFSRSGASRREEMQEMRRRNFLRQVDQKREDKRFEIRGEDIMRLDYLRQRRRWEAHLAREAADMLSVEEDDSQSTMQGRAWDQPFGSDCVKKESVPDVSHSGDEADEYLQWQDAELEALLEYMPESTKMSSSNEEMRDADNSIASAATERELWSDDDYDELFSDLLDQRPLPNQPVTNDTEDEAMDLS